jgi:hypothetical protein
VTGTWWCLRVCGSALALLAAAVPAGAAAPYREGQNVVVTGVVTDGQGMALPQLIVELEAARSVFNVRSLQRVKRDARVVASATTNERGEYSLEWPWSDYYDSFEVRAGVQVRKGEAETTWVLSQVDVTRRMGQGSPVVVAVGIDDTRFLSSLRNFLASVDTEDERRVYRALGKPDQVDTMKSPGHTEVTWWYFESGKAYRFRDGRLVQVEPFDPVRRF